MDIISSLPDPILCHILSFLGTKSYVRTSVLARRWRLLWTSVQNLRFEEEYYGYRSKRRMGFADIIYRMLLFHDGAIDSLSIRVPYDDINHYQIDAWISTAFARNLRVLHLSELDDVRLPERCFKCKSLVEMTIENCTISVKPGAVRLPKLKKLHLLYNYYEDDGSLPNLVSWCLALEDLVIERHGNECFFRHLCSPTLKSLVLTSVAECYNRDHQHMLVLDVPAIQYLRIEDNICYIIPDDQKLSSLVVADIMLSRHFPSQDEGDISLWSDAIFRFLDKLSNAKSLTFRTYGPLKELLNPTFSIATTRFHNLTQIKLQADWYILTELLHSAYKLELLTIELVMFGMKGWREPKHLPDCLSASLKHVHIFEFAGEEDELNVVRYILKHAQILKTIKIHFVFPYHGSKLCMLQQIAHFPRASKICQLILV
ncbi:F-box/FBD/LRR-repeat protein At4g26340-like [Henckelia pumila]|uniref:F-box/FBD/LRR-repeat protein At4g26340-like n=1 Tax=Henckelia pumila TaxID=405737 RepID=UPI003C6DBC44